MTFSQFLDIIYTNKSKKITRQEDFVRGLFAFPGADIYYDDSYFKKIYHGQRPISTDIREGVKKATNPEKYLNEYLKECINPKRMNDLFEQFCIPEDEKKDLNILIEALSIQFMNYIQYCSDEIPTNVADIYIILLDQYGNGSIEDANEKALYAAKNYFIQAVNAIASIRITEDLLTLQRPFENCFDSIYKAFKVYNDMCNHEGKELLKEMKNRFLNGKYPDIDLYLNKITEPGAKPIELIKELRYVIYDNYFFKDQVIEASIKLEDKDDRSIIIEKFKKLSFYPTNEIFFTEYLFYSEKGNNENLLLKSSKIFELVELILGSIELNLRKDYKPFERLKKALDEAVYKYNASNIQYIMDGVYYTEKGEIEYAPSIQMTLGAEDGSLIIPGNVKFQIDKDIVLKEVKNKPFDKIVEASSYFYGLLWKSNGYNDLMLEMKTFNSDGTFRYFMTPVTIKSRVYRLIRDIKDLVETDDITSFIYSSILVTYNFKNKDELSKIVNMTSNERQELGEERIITIGYKDRKKYAFELTKNDIENKMPPKPCKDQMFIFEPLIRSIMIKEEIKKSKNANKKSDSTQ